MSDTWPGMSADNHAAIQRYVTFMVKEMGLEHWVVEVASEPCTGTAKATVWKRDGHFEAILSVSADWCTYDRDAQRETVIHELLHVAVSVARNALNDALVKLLPEYVADAVWVSFCDHEEHSVSLLARALAHHFPLPDAVT